MDGTGYAVTSALEVSAINGGVKDLIERDHQHQPLDRADNALGAAAFIERVRDRRRGIGELPLAGSFTLHRYP
jgi:hypothetical protein